jgi:dihydropteroate synthase
MNMEYENNLFKNNYSIQVGGKLMDFSTVRLMGILNLTPDSFYDGGKYLSNEQKVLHDLEQMLEEGADIIDLGAFSSKPGSSLISVEEEEKRLLPALKSILKTFPEVILSVDTVRSSIAEKAIDMGAAIINDISAGKYDDKMFETIARLNVPYVLMHMQGDPESMQNQPTYDSVFNDVFHFFSKKLNELNEAGVNDVILDPGYGFGKQLSHNYKLLQQQNGFHRLGCPILVGVSRKGMIQKVINATAEEALNGTTAVNVIALLNGANILRVHDVKAAKEAIRIVDYFQKQ